MTADETALGSLHDKVARTLTRLLDGTDLPTGEVDDDGNDIVTKMEPSAAILTASIQFLKNNNITCQPAKDNALGELEAKLRESRNRKANRADLVAAREQVGFLSGLPN
ncbi:hypothetical protein [Sphingomonas sp.]